MRTPSLTAALRLIPAKWPQFSLRTLFITVTLVSITLGWYIPRVQNERRAADAVRAAGGNVVYDWQIRPENCPSDYQSDPPGPNLLRTLFGAHWFDSIAKVELNGDPLRSGKNRFELVAPHLLRLGGLRELRLWMAKLDQDNFQAIGTLPQLEVLSIGLRDELTPENTRELAKITSLQKLHLDKAHVSAQALRELARLPNLVELNISCDAYYPQTGEVVDEYRLRDDDAEAIGEFRNLRTLMLFETKITDTGLAHLCKNSQLECLVVSSFQITSASFAEVAKLERMRHLGTWAWKIDDADFQQLASLPNLTSLGLITRSVTDESIPYIVQLPHIKRLQFTGDAITDAGLPHLQRLTDLESLQMQHTAVNKLSQAANDLRAALPNCKMLLPRTPQEEAMHQAFIASKWGGGNSVIYQPKSTAPASSTSK
jgi:hypothetical protein